METSATEDLHDGDCSWTALVFFDRITGFYRMWGGLIGSSYCNPPLYPVILSSTLLSTGFCPQIAQISTDGSMAGQSGIVRTESSAKELGRLDRVYIGAEVGRGLSVFCA